MTAPFAGDTTGDRFVFILEGVVCGLVTSPQGGTISAPVVREPRGAFVHKRLGAPAPEPIELFLDFSLQKLVYEWVNEFWQGQAIAKSGSLIAVDANFQATTELQFENAVISATTVPAVDAMSKTACALAVQLSPTATNLRNASGPVAGLALTQKKAWLASNFRLNIEGLDTTRVSSVSALTITNGEESTIDFPDLRVLVEEQSSKTWADWHDQFVVRGKNDDTQEKTGSVVFLSPDLQSQLGSVTFSGLGIYRLALAPTLPGGPINIRRTVAELYCQRMALVV